MRSFQAADNLYSYFTKPFQLLFSMTTSLSTLSTFTIFSKGNNSGFNRRSVRSDSVRSYTTSTPNRQSAPNLMTVLPLPNNQDLELTSSPSKGNELTAEIDLSDDLGVSPIHDSHEDTPMFTPRTNSRIVRIISKQSNV